MKGPSITIRNREGPNGKPFPASIVVSQLSHGQNSESVTRYDFLIRNPYHCCLKSLVRWGRRGLFNLGQPLDVGIADSLVHVGNPHAQPGRIGSGEISIWEHPHACAAVLD